MSLLQRPRPPWFDTLRVPPAKVPSTATRPAPPLFDATHQLITTPDAWAARRQAIEKDWHAFLGAIPSPRAVSPLRVVEEDEPGVLLRQLVRYESEPGLPVLGYLIRPRSRAPEGGRPGAVVLHSTVDYTIRQPAGLEGPADKHIGIHLAERGYVVFCPMCFLWQYSRNGKIAEAVDWLRARHPGVTGMSKMLFDAVRAVDHLIAQPDVDPKRIAAIGHSLGAKEALYLAAFDTRIRATVSSEGGIGLTYSNWDAPWYLGDAIKRPGFPLDHGQVLAMTAPRAFLLIGGDSADGAVSWPYIEAGLPVWNLLKAPEALGLFNHGEGHAFPKSAQTRAYEWLDWFL